MLCGCKDKILFCNLQRKWCLFYKKVSDACWFSDGYFGWLVFGGWGRVLIFVENVFCGVGVRVVFVLRAWVVRFCWLSAVLSWFFSCISGTHKNFAHYCCLVRYNFVYLRDKSLFCLFLCLCKRELARRFAESFYSMFNLEKSKHYGNQEDNQEVFQQAQ